MTLTPTPEQFLAQPSSEEDDLDEPPTLEGALWEADLGSIAASLRTIATAVVRRDTQEAIEDENKQALDQLDREYAELERLHDAKQALIEEVLKVCKPSVSKLANQVRETVAKWRSPEIEPVGPPEPDEPPVVPAGSEAIVEPGPRCEACERYFADQALLEAHACTAEPPASDAPVEEWREYARTVGVPLEEPDGIDSMNRSQIRTLLGIPHVD